MRRLKLIFTAWVVVLFAVYLAQFAPLLRPIMTMFRLT